MDARGTNPSYEEYDAAVEWSRAAEADAVKIFLPGFKREQTRVLVDNHGHLRTSGERPVTGNRWSRFQKDFQLPADCNVDGIRAQFENETLTITLPKKSPSPQAAPVSPPVPPPAIPETPKPSPLPRAPVPPPAIPETPKPSPLPRAPAPPPVPATTLPPAPSQNNGGGATTKPGPAEVPKTKEEGVKETKKPPTVVEEEENRMEREVSGKMEEGRKMVKGEEGVMDTVQQRRPISASRGLLVNVAVAVVVLAVITVYVWHTLRNATAGGDHGHGESAARSYSDEM